ncbi:GlsB/YeaQ/YmgE family stress response membrane protein [Pseudonocardia halophobica]|uniref:Membrane protein n=1 Tax=Pseudonocardia halophobica TaxID=29401 RepID=A0A9W6KVJ7_9PSEU|nr:GlsB/YeaQ/YmgE family stress response membrane protein [Pseudonocardia halophobica]GLL08882.1 membrane protein [Pseudonocardia halophobica]
MGVIGWIVVGLIVGALAKLIMPGKDPGGIIVTCIIGIVGGLLGGWISSALFGVDTGSFFDLRTWVIALIGSLVLLGIYRLIVGRRSRSHA